MSRKRGLERFVQPSIRELIKKPVHVALPLWCAPDGCGALVRMLGENKIGGSWYCPLCGCARPFAFWEFKTQPGGVRFAREKDLILELNPKACKVCGELPECRCDRMFMDGVKDGLKP